MSPSLGALSFLAASVLALPSAAQEPNPSYAPEVRGGTGTPIERVVHATWDVQAERIRSVRTSAPNEIAFGNPPCFDNSLIELPDDPQFVVSNPGEELVAIGQKNCPGAGRLRSFTIAYRSEAVDTSLGGPGAVFALALFTNSPGFGNVGTEIFRRNFTGMPSSGAAASSTVQYDHNGNAFLTSPDAPLVFLTIDFGVDPLPMTDGPIGWSFLQLDGDTGPALVRAPRPLVGTRDALDIYSPGPPSAASYLGTFNYGGCSGPAVIPPCACLYIQLDEIANTEVALTTVVNGSGANPEILEEILPARIGHLWAARVDVIVPPFSTPNFSVLYVSAGQIAPVPTPFGEVLVDPGQQLLAPQLAEGTYTFAIPADTALIGNVLYLQAAVLPPVATRSFLTNALRVRVGF